MTTYRADQIADVIVARSGSFLSAMQLQKLLYYVQSWHVAITDAPAFSEQIKAWADGPVVPQVWHSRKDPSTRTAAAAAQDALVLPLDELTSDLVDLVLASYGSMSGDELSALTHAEVPWREARGELAEDAHSSEPIPLDSMAEFYRQHRKLGGRTAADLAAGGIHIRAADAAHEQFDIDSFLAGLGGMYDDCGSDEFGGGNLAVPDDLDDRAGLATEPRRAYQGA